MIRVSSIQTGIELNDQFSSVLNNIINSVNLAIFAMENMQGTMNADIDTSALESVRDEINQATMALNEMEAAAKKQAAPDVVPPLVDPGNQEPVSVPIEPIPPDPLIKDPESIRPEIQPNAPPEPVEIPVQWQTEGLEVFTGSGVERFRQEVQDAGNLLEQLSNTQDTIARQAYDTTLLSPEAYQDLNRLSVRIDMIRDRVQKISDNPVNMGTDKANAELEQLRIQLIQAVQEQNELNTAMEGMDVSDINAAYLRLSQTVGNTERYIRDNTDEQGRFNEEVREGTGQADNLMNTIKSVVSAYVGVQTVGKALNISDELIQTTSRLDMMNDKVQTTQELVNMVYAAAQDSRGAFGRMADVVARFGNNAKDAFDSSAEVVAFANLIQKQMTIAGASTQEAANAELQLSQALGSGVLRGDELNSIFEQAPNLIQSIADYLDVPIGQIREMAAEGELTADIVKAAIFSAADDINAKFESMPMTWGQMWQSMQNTALIAFQPVLQRLNNIANSESFQKLSDNAIRAMAALANIVLDVLDLMTSGAAFAADNWSIISPIIYGIISALVAYGTYLAITKGIEMATAAGKVILIAAEYAHAAATGAVVAGTTAEAAAQMKLNTALLSCPIFWIIAGIIAVVTLLAMLCNWIAKTTGAAQSGIGIIVGALAVGASVIANLVIGLINMVITQGVNLYNLIANFAAAFGVIFNDPVAAIKAVILSMLDFIVGVVSKAASLLDAVFGSNLSDAISGFQDQIQAKIDATIENAGGTAAQTLDASDYTLDRINYGDAFSAGAALGDGIADKIGDFSLSNIFGNTDIPNVNDYTSGFSDVMTGLGMSDNLDNIAGDTGNISDAMDITEEDLKYLRDIAEQEAVNRFTTAEITVNQTNNNNVSSGMDLDGVVSGLTDAVNEAVDSMTEGVHQ